MKQQPAPRAIADQSEGLDRPEALLLKCRLTAADHGRTLLNLLTQRFSYRDETSWHALLNQGLVRLNGLNAEPGCLVAAGDELTYLLENFREPEVPAHFEQILKTTDLLLIGKAAGTPVTRTGVIIRQTLVNILRQHYQEEIHPLHRLDRETSGLILCARNQPAARRQQSPDRAPWLGKYYLALVRGGLNVHKLTVDQPLSTREDSPVRCRMWPQSAGKPCRTIFHTIASTGDYTLMLAELRTGRRHQIRAHLAHLGHPVIGDKIYDHDSRYYLKRLSTELSAEDFRDLGARHHTLHAWSMRLQLPEQPATCYFSNLFSTDFSSYLHRFPDWEFKARQLLTETCNAAITLPPR